MGIRIHVVDSVNIYHPEQVPQRTGWHDLYGSSEDALNGNIARVFLTKIPQDIASSNWQQTADYTCGPSALCNALGLTTDADPLYWLHQRGLIDGMHGTDYGGIVGYVNSKGFDCSYDGKAHDGEMSGAIYDQIVDYMQHGYKVILCMHHPRSRYWTNSGHYILCDAIIGGGTGGNYMFEMGNVRLGTQGVDAYQAQVQLKGRGFYKGALDFSAGPQTMAAWKAYVNARKTQGVKNLDDSAINKAGWTDLFGKASK